VIHKSHQTAVFIEISESSRDQYKERVNRFLQSVFNGDNIKADLYFVTNGQVYPSTTGLPEDIPTAKPGTAGLVDYQSLHNYAHGAGYNMQVIISDAQQTTVVEELDPEMITQLLRDMK
jgi:hypothetical protein